MTIDRHEQKDVEAAAAEAARIGGRHDRAQDPALHPVLEAGGGGEAEGFEQAEEQLVEHASHGDQCPAHTVLHGQGEPEEASDEGAAGEADHERSAEYKQLDE